MAWLISERFRPTITGSGSELALAYSATLTNFQNPWTKLYYHSKRNIISRYYSTGPNMVHFYSRHTLKKITTCLNPNDKCIRNLHKSNIQKKNKDELKSTNLKFKKFNDTGTFNHHCSYSLWKMARQKSKLKKN